MKNLKYIMVALFVSVAIVGCKDDDDSGTEPMVDNGPEFSGTYEQEDQMARPAINTVFVSSGDKNTFNRTVPSAQGTAFQSKFQTQLTTLNANYSTNALGQDAAAFTTLLATDVLNVSLDGTTTFFDGNAANTLSGRRLADDVIDTELLLIFGGPDGTENPGLTKDNVGSNDKAFSTSFPYLATPH